MQQRSGDLLQLTSSLLSGQSFFRSQRDVRGIQLTRLAHRHSVELQVITDTGQQKITEQNTHNYISTSDKPGFGNPGLG